MHLNYKLTQKNIEESLLCLSWKKEKQKIWRIVIISGIAGFFLIRFAQNPSELIYFFLLLFSIVLLFLLVYLPKWRRYSTAKKIAEKKGIYEISILDNAIVWKDKKYDYDEKTTAVYSSERVYTVKAKEEVFCIPKTVFQKTQEKEFLSILERNKISILCVNTGGEEDYG